ncbi:putative short chain dehydrogenase [Staphylococcus agnetis]|nr:putative short chain dehydrogenase [Staphylococcus agnetis]
MPSFLHKLKSFGGIMNKHFVVTGGTSGLGLEIVRNLLRNNIKVTLLARDINKCKTLFNEDAERLTFIKCDLLNKKDIQSISTKIDSTIDGLIYSSGIGHFNKIMDQPIKDVEETYMTNVIHFHLLLHTLKPYINSQFSLVGISSLAASVTQAEAGHYGGSKAALNHVLNCLRIENAHWHVMAVNPGPIDTVFHEKADPSMTYAKKYKRIMMKPDKLAKEIVDAIFKNKSELNKPKWMDVVFKLYQLCPRFLEKHFKMLFKFRQ